MYRTESDSLGTINVPSNKYWGAQTQRSIENFKQNQFHILTIHVFNKFCDSQQSVSDSQ